MAPCARYGDFRANHGFFLAGFQLTLLIGEFFSTVGSSRAVVVQKTVEDPQEFARFFFFFQAPCATN